MSGAAPRGARRARLAGAARLLALAALFVAGLAAQPSAEEPPAEGADAPAPFVVRTHSPRDTFASFLRLSEEMERALGAYLAAPSFAGVTRLALLSDQMTALIDLEATPAAARREVGIRTATYLLDVLRRLPPVDPADLPDAAAMDAAGLDAVRIPGAPFAIVRMTDGPRVREHLFSPSTIEAAPRLFRALRALPMRSSLDIESFSALSPQLTGPLIPPALVRAIPEPLTRLWFGTPVWKALLTAALGAALALALVALLRALSTRPEGPGSRLNRLSRAAVPPILLLLAADVALPYLAFQINLSGAFADSIASAKSVLSHVAVGWLFWLAVRMVFEAVILSPRISDASLDANLLRLLSNVIGIVGVTVIVAMGGQAVGLPVLSVLAGLGIGGLAVALALRPTLENLVGGVMLFIDRPVRVGDFCRFGDQTGTVESIGVRSTKVRALDRTLITVPNAQFADMQIVNFAYCDQMLIRETVGLRYETTPDQLRHLLAEIRRMLHAHPRIDSETVRVRLAGFGESALNLDLRVYAETREWNDFFAIREDVFLRLCEIVQTSGSGFAFPSRTLYLARDGGLDAERATAAEDAVKAWRRSGRLPFPRLAGDEIERLRGTLDYPPRGSVERRRDGLEAETRAEPLSASADDPPLPGAETESARDDGRA
jgi:MscS family membrane protein